MRKSDSVKRNILWLSGEAAVLGLAVFAAYYWRVFYSFDKMGAAKLTLLLSAAFTLLYASIFCAVRFARSLAAKAACLLAVVGICTALITPPMQVPDESSHYLRACAISMGRFDFDADRGYTQDVDMLLECFPAAYTNAQDGAPVKQYYHLEDPDDAGSAKIPDGEQLSVKQCYDKYKSRLAAVQAGDGTQAANKVSEPLVVQILPYLPQAAGMAIARLLGGDALTMLYAGRVFNLAVYVLLAYLTLKMLTQWQGVFLAVLFLPISVYMAASLSYDAQLLGLYTFAAALLLRQKFGNRELWCYLSAVTAMCVAKPWINLLWLFGLFFIPKENWQVDKKHLQKRWVSIALGMLLAVGIALILTWYGRSFRYHYGVVGRMIQEVDVLQQVSFIVHNPLRTVAVFWGTLFENTFFLPGLGSFGALDTQIPVVAWCSGLLLVAGAVSVGGTKPLAAKLNIGLALFTVIYTVSVMGAMYITYTPVGMVRIIGLQLRYFIPAILTGLLFLGQGSGMLMHSATGPDCPKIDRPKLTDNPMLYLGFGCAIYAAVLQLETYFVGPVIWKLSEVL